MSTSCSASAGYRGNDYAAALDDAVGLDLAAGDAGRRGARTSAAVVARRRAPRSRALATPTSPDAVLDAIEADVTPDDRMVIVHTSGSTSAPKGVIHQHGPLLGHLDTLNGMRGSHAGTRLFSNSPMFWIGGLAYNVARRARRRRHPPVLGARRTRPRRSTSSSASAPSSPTASRSRSRAGRGPVFATRDFSSIRSGNLYPLLPPALRPADPELRHNMLGITETGSVCLMSRDETDQPEHRRGSFGRRCPGSTPASSIPRRSPTCRPASTGELWFRGPSLMEGYYGRERHDVVHARRLVPHRRPLPPSTATASSTSTAGAAT